MLRALNYTTKAIEALTLQLPRHPTLSQVGIRYVLGKLKQAQVFILPEYGTILDRGAMRPHVPEAALRPPFDVVALEYEAPLAKGVQDPVYCPVPSSRRIALVWRWDDADLPAFLGPGDVMGPGVGLASLAYLDMQRDWMLVAGALHIPDDGAWVPQPDELSPFQAASIASGRAKKVRPGEISLSGRIIPLMPETIVNGIRTFGDDRMFDSVNADLADELNAYFDMCCALACQNVGFERHAASQTLNRARRASGKAPLRDFHILKLAGAVLASGGSETSGRNGTRSHLRRGHIRRLPGERVTWVNQTMVHGRQPGFVDKAYAL